MKIEDLLFMVLFVVAVVLGLWYIFGQSPTIEQTILGAILAVVVKNHGDIREIKGRFDEIKGRLEEHLRNHK